jgi:hypothetical protein
MNLSTHRGISNEDVREFRRLLEEENKSLTPKKARESLIRSGVLDSNGKPRWPTKQKSRTARKKVANSGK